MKHKKQFCVLGLGRFGKAVALTLAQNGFEVLTIDQDSEVIDSVSEHVASAIVADVSDETALKEAGLSNCDVAIVAIGSHLEASVMATILAKELGVKYVLTKAYSNLHQKILEKIGADKVLIPEKEMGIRVANNLMSDNIFEYIELSKEYDIVEIPALKEWHGKTLSNSGIRSSYGINIIAIKNSKKTFVTPDPGMAIAQGDILVAVGESRQIKKVFEKIRAGG